MLEGLPLLMPRTFPASLSRMFSASYISQQNNIGSTLDPVLLLPHTHIGRGSRQSFAWLVLYGVAFRISVGGSCSGGCLSAALFCFCAQFTVDQGEW